ncbi:MAG TPA: tetratricopeptide repeat protein [Steroidobacteraceae bacterium]|jgi:adenylate cyclase|nr:tetratricopeptide repeat protein [Steroidobacteraceae bacterium]
MLRFLAELKRRKVIQTAVLYAVASWALLQVAALLLDMLEVPPWGLKLVFVLLLIGFPLALLLSWMHQVTPEGIRREAAAPEAPRRLPPAGAFSSHAADAPAAAMLPQEPAADERSIAVLPFANLSEDKANEYFADGLSDELLNLLSRVAGLRVVARTSSFSFKGRTASAAEIARELKVTHLLEGSVRRSGSRVRITAQLIRASDSSHVWSQSFDRDLSDIFAVQDEIAAAVARGLELKLFGGPAPKAQPTDPRAYALYLQGRHFFSLYSATGYAQAIPALEGALAIDPGFAPAWGILGALYWGQANNSLIPYGEGARKARLASDKALALDPEQAEPMSLLGLLDVIEHRDVARGLQRIQRALELEPHNQRVLSRAANVARQRGRTEEAIGYAEQALNADPLSPNAHAVLGLTYYYAGRLDDAEAMRRRLLALSPGWLSGYYYLGRILLERGDARAALAAMEQEPSPMWRLTGLALVHHALGSHVASDAALEELRKEDPVGIAYQFAEIHAYRGETDLAFEWLERAEATNDSGLTDAITNPLMRSLHTDPRWAALVARLRLD